MWKATLSARNPPSGPSAVAPASAVLARNGDDDDWETEPDFVNEMSEEQQRWGGARDIGTIKCVIQY
jgi:hypothetical protein